MKLRDRIAELEAENAALRAELDTALAARLDALLASPEALRQAIVARANTAPDQESLMAALRALDIVPAN